MRITSIKTNCTNYGNDTNYTDCRTASPNNHKLQDGNSRNNVIFQFLNLTAMNITIIRAITGTCILLTGMLGFRPLQSKKDNTLSAAEKKAGWILLFNGKSTDGWRGYNNKPYDSWEVVDGQLHC